MSFYLMNRLIKGNNVPFGFQICAITDMTDANRTLTAAEYACPIIEISGTTLTANRNIILPATAGATYIVRNKTTTSIYNLVFKASTGNGVSVLSDGSGTAVIIYYDGTDYVSGRVAVGSIDLTTDITGTLPMTNGGTGVSAITGSGLVKVTSGAIQGAAVKIDLASSSYIDAATTLPMAQGGTGRAAITGTGPVRVVSGAIASAATPLSLSSSSDIDPSSVLPVANGGTGRSSITGTGFVKVTSGAFDAASTTAVTLSGSEVTGTLPMTKGGTGVTAITGTGYVHVTSGVIDGASSSPTEVGAATVQFASTLTDPEVNQAQKGTSGASNTLVIRSQASQTSSGGASPGIKFITGLNDGSTPGKFKFAYETTVLQAQGSTTALMEIGQTGATGAPSGNVYLTGTNGPFVIGNSVSGQTIYISPGTTNNGDFIAIATNHKIQDASANNLVWATTSGVSFFGSPSLGGGNKVIYIHNATTVPSTNPSNGGVLYVEGGALKYMGSSGTITPIAPA